MWLLFMYKYRILQRLNISRSCGIILAYIVVVYDFDLTFMFEAELGISGHYAALQHGDMTVADKTELSK